MMENNEFFDLIKSRLQEMTLQEKDDWILSQAQQIADSRQQDFLISLNGFYNILNMPTIEEIDEFFNNIQNGKIYFEKGSEFLYEWFSDPFEVFPYLNRILNGCHDLIRLKQYQKAYEILNTLYHSEFKVIIKGFYEDSYDEYDFHDLLISESLYYERRLTIDEEEIAHDWIESYLCSKTNDISAKKLIEIFDSRLCNNLCFSDFKELLSKDIIIQIKNILIDKKNRLNDYKNREHPTGEFAAIALELIKTRIMLEDIENKCLNVEMIDDGK